MANQKTKQKNIIEFVLIFILVVSGVYLIRTGLQGLAPHDLTGRGEDGIRTNYAPLNEDIAEQMASTQPSADEQFIQVDEDMLARILEAKYQYDASLSDVTEGGDIRGHLLDGKARALVETTYVDDTFMLYTTFENMPEEKKNFFYEGWLVRRDPFDYISVGPVFKLAGQMTNIYASSNDFTDYDFYVVTVEPDDSNPLPSHHLLEGVIYEKAP